MKGNVTFKNINRLFRLAKIFNSFVGLENDPDKVTKQDIMKQMTTIRIRTSKTDIQRLEELLELIENRYINFKHFVVFMNAKALFKH